jgi:hypothetical protein
LESHFVEPYHRARLLAVQAEHSCRDQANYSNYIFSKNEIIDSKYFYGDGLIISCMSHSFFKAFMDFPKNQSTVTTTEGVVISRQTTVTTVSAVVTVVCLETGVVTVVCLASPISH